MPEGTRTINIVDTSEVLLDKSMVPPVKVVFIYNHNPVVTHPDQNRMRRALAQEDLFIAGADVVMTDSMAYCDVVLPAASHFEFADIYGSYGHHYLQRAEPVIPRVGESLPNTEIFRRLAARFGFDDQIFQETDAELMDAAFTDTDPRLGGINPSELPLDQALAMTTMDGADLILCDTVFPGTSSGKIELFSQNLEERFGYGLPRFEPVERRYPLSIISPSSSKRTNTTFGNCVLSEGQEEVEINPLDAKMRGISDGDTLRVHNERGETLLTARVTDAVLPGVLYTPKGAWLSASKTGQTVNALLNADIRTDIEDGACCNEAFCATIATLLAEGDEVILPTPWYFNHKMALDMIGATSVALPTGPSLVPDAEDAAQLITERTRAIALVSPNNPAGVEYPPEVLSAFFELCQARGITLILDETYRDFDSRSRAPHSLLMRDGWDQVLVQLYSFSKAYRLTGHRVGAVIGQPELLHQIEKFQDTVAICAPSLGQRAALWGLENLGQWKAEQREEILDRRAAIEEHFAPLAAKG